MNTQDATDLSMKMTATWSHGPKAEIWAEVFEELHTKQAQEAYRRLRESEDKAPSIARFRSMYQSLTLHDEQKSDCVRCEGSGFVEASPVVHTKHCPGVDRCHCSAVVPCHCPLGKDRAAVFSRIVASKPHVAGGVA